jgi:hypothetical protein
MSCSSYICAGKSGIANCHERSVSRRFKKQMDWAADEGQTSHVSLHIVRVADYSNKAVEF